MSNLPKAAEEHFCQGTPTLGNRAETRHEQKNKKTITFSADNLVPLVAVSQQKVKEETLCLDLSLKVLSTTAGVVSKTSLAEEEARERHCENRTSFRL